MSFFNKMIKSPRFFTVISWGVTAVIVVALLGFGVWHFLSPRLAMAAPAPAAGDPTAVPAAGGTTSAPVLDASDNGAPGLVRLVTLKTDISSSTNYTVGKYTIKHGDAIFSIAKKFNIKPESLMWANYDIWKDNPDSLREGQTINIPPVDGVYYKWQEGDSIQSIADKFKVTPDDILNWPGNNIDLSNPEIPAGTYVMVPGGKRQSIQWFVAVVASGSSGTANVGGSSCGDGPVDNNFQWPAPNHSLSGNDFWSGHLGIDIAAGEGTPVWASAGGVVTMAQGGDNYGYGNVVMIYHGNGYSTLYGHLSQINVIPCQVVSAFTVIGYAGSTGNSTGAHLHFEIRSNGQFINPWNVLP